VRTRSRLVAVSIVATLAVAACGSDSADNAAGAGASKADCAKGALPLKKKGTLTVATGEPVFSPWMDGDANDPTTGKGFESALVYELATAMGFSKEEVAWVRTGFDEAIAPGAKSFDFNIQQYSITVERAKVVSFSSGYYDVQQAIVAAADSKIASAKSLADLKGAKLGAAIGTTSLDYIDKVIQPSTKAAVFDDNAAAKLAFDAKQVDGIVFDLPTAFYITAVEIPESKIVGILPSGGTVEQLGMLFEKDSKLVPCVNAALAGLVSGGRTAALAKQWLAQGGSIPTLTK
jgi:polar amino acid transport system substrate-binding protein